MLDCPLMLGVNLHIVNTICLQQNKTVTAATIRLEGEPKLTRNFLKALPTTLEFYQECRSYSKCLESQTWTKYLKLLAPPYCSIISLLVNSYSRRHFNCRGGCCGKPDQCIILSWRWSWYVLCIFNNIRLWARDFYELIVDEAEGRINYHLIEIESE